MVKRVILVVLMIVPMMVMAQNIKLGKVDKVAIFNAMPEKVEAEAQIKLLSDQYQKEYDLLRAEYNRKYADFQAMAIDNKTPGTIKERRMQELQEKLKRLQTEYDYDESALVVDHDDGLKGVMPKEILGTPTLVEFEGQQFCGVEQAHAYLSRKYGEYMVIPDGDHQRQHNFHFLDMNLSYKDYKENN